MLKVSAVIPGYNYARFLGEAIDSVLSQTYRAHEIIVVDDGSTDDTPAIARGYGEKVRYFRTENRGVSAARNTGIAQATGDLIAFLDADDRWLPHKLERQAPFFASDPMLGLVHTGSRVFDSQSGAPQCEILPEASSDFHALLANCGVSAPSAVVPRNVFAKVGGFDEKLSNAADWDMWIRIAAAYKVSGCREILVEYREHGASMSRGNELKQFRECLTVLEKSSQIHPGCKLCSKAARAARQRLGLLFYNTSTAAARAHERQGRRWQGLAQRLSPFRHHPKLIFVLPEIIRHSIAARNELRRLKALNEAASLSQVGDETS